jgi:hypothetical protein
MTEPTVICPNRKTEIKLTESLIAAKRMQFEHQLAQKDSDIVKRVEQIEMVTGVRRIFVMIYLCVVVETQKNNTFRAQTCLQ